MATKVQEDIDNAVFQQEKEVPKEALIGSWSLAIGVAMMIQHNLDLTWNLATEAQQDLENHVM
mgnify:CR=1 FL=1